MEKERLRDPLRGPMTSFSATCSRLSQHLKAQQRLAATAAWSTTSMSLKVLTEAEGGISRHTSDRRPMNLFPQHAGFGTTSPEEENAHLTIFYGGQMLVLDDFPADKAKDLLLMAVKGNLVNPPTSVPAVAALPLMRRASLQRFIEKRRERINSSKITDLIRYHRNCG